MLSERRRAKCEELCPDAMEHYDRIDDAGPSPDYVMDDGRASGQATCEVCGHIYHDHPEHPFEPCLTIACDGKLLKL